MKAKFHSTCVDFNGSINKLDTILTNAREINRATFVLNVNKEQRMAIEADCGYADHHTRGMTMAQDSHVTYHKSPGGWYFFRWSAIEFLFLRRE